MELEKMLCGKGVVHSKLGRGIIEEMNDGYIIVRFETGDKTSRFLYPDAFEKFLRLEDDGAQAVVAKHLTVKHLLDVQEERKRREKLRIIDEELKAKHREEQIKKQRAAMLKQAREKRIKNKKKVMA